jgi:hypothetical protein
MVQFLNGCIASGSCSDTKVVLGIKILSQSLEV